MTVSDDGQEPATRLGQLRKAKAALLDDARPKAVKRQADRNVATVRSVISELFDTDSFVELGGLALPAVAGMEGAGDGVVMGFGRVGGAPADFFAYDYSVYAGTQSTTNHRKVTRIIQHAAANGRPLLCWLDGGGARPHDMLVEGRGPTSTFVDFARLSGVVPRIGVVPGVAFAGQANLAGMCDILIATRNSVLGLAGPPLVEAAMGQKMTPQEIGGVEKHVKSGVVDLLVEDSQEAIRLARRVLGYFASPEQPVESPDATELRGIVPDSPRRAYDVRRVVQGIVDKESMLELKPSWGRSIVTCLARLNGRTVGVLANQPMMMAGGIDAASAAKAARFIQICDAFDFPVVLLCDTPGLLVGPDVEETGLVRHSARMLTALATSTVPILTVVLRKAYGLGYYIMGSAAFQPDLLVAWPTAEFGGMGLEGAVNIIHRRELDATPSADERKALHGARTEELRRANTVFAAAERFQIDDVIDPADTRALLIAALAHRGSQRSDKRMRRIIDAF